MLNFFLTKKVVVKFILFYTFFTNYLSQKGFCAPSVGLARKGGEATEQGGVSTGCAKIALFKDFRGGVSKVSRSPKSSKGAATGSSRAEGD